MNIDLTNLPDNVDQLKMIIQSLSVSYRNLEEKNREKISFLEEHIQLLKNELFGRKTEKRPEVNEKQLRLFDELPLPESEKETPEKERITRTYTRKKSGRKPIPKELPRVEIIHDIPDGDKTCGCGSELCRIGEEVCEKLDFIPAKIQVLRHIRYKYACKECEGVEDEGPTVKIAPAPPRIIPKSMASAGLLAHVIVSKFEDALPFYRQEKILQRLGIDLGRSSLCNWAMKVAEKIEPLMCLLHTDIRSGPLINIDETPVQVLKEAGRANTGKSYMWVYRGGDPEKPVLMYQYHPSRSGKIPLSFLEEYQGYIQTDGYQGYELLARNTGVVMVGCFAHVRRKFVEVIKAKPVKAKKGLADEALDYIGKLYQIEKEIKELEPAEIFRIRQEKAKPLLDEFHEWLLTKSVSTPPKGLLGKAIRYALKLWNRLIRYVEDGRLRPDNNLAENAIRPFVLGRKNWLFSGSPKGAQASANIYSLIETAKANGLKPYEYFRYLLEKIPTEADYRRLLPQNIDPAILSV